MRTKLENRCLEFAVATIKLVRNYGGALTKRNREQLCSLATSIGANVAEARSAQSKSDFISKLEIALKEARETDYWLNVMHRVTSTPPPEMTGLHSECDQITAMLVASVKTAKANLRQHISQTAEWRV